ncbi:MAG: PQQ-dependent sugar dehydrogenase [Chloroflexota bacterium]
MRKFTSLVLLGMLFAVSAFGVIQAQDTARTAPPNRDGVQLVPYADGFDRPLFAAGAGDDSGRLFVVEQGGKIWIVTDGQKSETPFLDVSELLSRDVFGGGYSERGLLGLAFAPDFASSGAFYINYSDLNGDTVVARYHISADDPNVADPASAVTILTQEQPYPNHNGGNMAFGADGYLYISFGDGGSGGDPENRAQNLGTWLGKILRIDVSGDSYTVPENNPFVGVEGVLPEIWAYGLRNPWRFSFDRETHDLYIGEVGQGDWEEIDFQPADSTGGENYGWRVYEGLHPFSGEAVPPDLVTPIAEYAHNLGASVSGGYVYRGSMIPDLVGVYLYGDFGTGTIWTLYRDASGEWQDDVFMPNSGHSISSFGQDDSGELYLVDYSGTILRFEPVS